MAIELSEKQIKDGWQIVKFGEIAKNISERVEPSETDLDVYVGLEHLDPQSLRITRRGVPSDVKGQKLRVRPGQIIFGKRRAYQKKVAVADFDGICSAHAMVLEEVVGKIIPGLLPFFMQSDMFMDRAVAISEGSLSPTIKWKTLAIQEFPLPPIERQKEILEVLEKVEDNLKRTVNASNSLNILSKKILSTLSSSNFKCKLGVVCEIVSGQHISASDYNNSGEGVSYLTGPDDFSNGKINTTKYTKKPKTMCQKGDVLLTVKGSGVGKSVISDNNYCISRQLMALRGHNVNSKYLSLAMRLLCVELNKHSCGVIPGLSKKQIAEFEIPDPQKTNTAPLIATMTVVDDFNDSLLKRRLLLNNLKSALVITSLFQEGALQ